MKQLKIIAFMLCGLLLATSVQATQRNLAVTASNAQEQKRVALVIGNGNYQHSATLQKLANPPHDAEDIAAALRSFGFEVMERKNQTRKEMKTAINEFSLKIGNSDAALFYYAGHGLQVKGQNYLMPVDAAIEPNSTDADLQDEGINVSLILENMDDAKSKVNIVMLDACRAPLKEGKFRSAATRGLAAIGSPPKGTVIVYATDPGNVAADGDGRNGLFTAGLLKAFKGSDLSLHGVLVRTSKEVERGSDKQQTPYINGPATLQEEFQFASGQGAQVASLVPVPAQPARIKSKEEIEQEGWESARDSNDIDAVNEYLKQYPKGRFAGQAKILIATLKKSPAKPAEPAEPVTQPSGRADGENDLWTEAQKGNSKEDYQAYLDQYPKGKYVALARSRIKKLQDDAQAATEQQEQQAWDAVQDENSEAGYTRYLKGYPNGRYAGLARARQEKLKNDLAAARQKKLEEEAAQQAKQEREAAARQEAERQKQEEERKRKQAEAPKYVSQGGLTWMPVSSTQYKHAQATALCAGSINGQTGWRLPTKDELVSLYNSGAAKGQGWTLNYTWSSTPRGSDSHYVVGLDDGNVGGWLYDTLHGYVACVR